MIDQPDFQQIFNRLCHVAALSRDGKTRAAVESLIVNSFAVDKLFLPKTAKEVADAVREGFDLVLGEATVQASIDRLLTDKRLVRDRVSKKLSLAPAVRAQVDLQIKEASELEDRVRAAWFQTLDDHIEITDSRKDQLWAGLGAYMAKAFQRHGVETIQLLDPANANASIHKESLSSYLEQSLNDCCDESIREVAREYIPRFFLEASPDRVKYVAQLLDGTFTYFALTVDQATSAYLQEGISPLTLLLDTNCIFGALELHLSPFNEVIREIIETIKTHKLPFKLYYHEETLLELRRVIGTVSDRVKGRHWTQALSRAAVETGMLTGLELKYHELNADSICDPGVYFSKYEHIEDLLHDLGLTIYRAGTNALLDQQRHELVAEYKQFADTRRPSKPKDYPALNHDMAVWQTVRSLRRKGVSLLDSGAFFLTLDYLLYRFDWEHRRNPQDFGLVILANQFMQLLRPFVPTSTQTDQHFMEIFAAAEFRTAVTDYTTTSSKVLSYMSTYSDLSQATAVRILTDEVLMHQLQDIDEESIEFQKLVDSKLARDNEELIRRAEEFKGKVDEAERKAAQSEAVVTQTLDELRKVKERAAAAEAREYQTQLMALASKEKLGDMDELIQKTRRGSEAELEQKNSQISSLEQRLNRLSTSLRVFGALMFCLLGMAAIVFSKFIKWEWLENHPNRLGLYGCAILIVACITWSVIDQNKTRRTIALLPLGVAVLAVLLQILGR